MRSLKLIDGDLVIAGGDFVMIDGDEELAQSVASTMQTAKGEWFLNVDFGMEREPFETKPFNEEEVNTAIIEAATDDERIAAVENLSAVFEKTTRQYSIFLELRKTDGTTVAIEEVGI